MDTLKLLIASSVAFVPLIGSTADRGAREASDRTDAAVAALKGSFEKTTRIEVEEVRVTEDGVVCIDYHMLDDPNGIGRAHAVVQGDEVLRSTTASPRFEEAWTDHCLGPRGGMTPAN
jgi:hypothetical protein